MLTIHVWPKRLKEFLLTHPLYKSPRQIRRGGLTTKYTKYTKRAYRGGCTSQAPHVSLSSQGFQTFLRKAITMCCALSVAFYGLVNVFFYTMPLLVGEA